MEFIFLCVRIYFFWVYALFIWINYSFISALNWYMCTKVLPFLGWIWVWAEVLHFISSKILFTILHPRTLSWQSLIVVLLVLIFLSSDFLFFLLLPSCCFFSRVSLTIWPSPLASISKVRHRYFHLSPFLTYHSIPSQ